ncbi:MAG TPA: hypothetical protein DDZ76_14495 [Xanthomonadales bacterium]|nr:hypothetical protein [Xanthomonadales bacterium]
MKKLLATMLIGALTLGLAACENKEEKAKAERAKAAAAAAEAAMVVPTTTDPMAWRTYLTEVVKRNMEGIKNPPFMYFLPAPDTENFDDVFRRQADNVGGAIARGVLPDNLLAFGSPDSAKLADLIDDAFDFAEKGSMKGVRVLFVGKPADFDRVRAAVEPSGANVVFHSTE